MGCIPQTRDLGCYFCSVIHPLQHFSLALRLPDKVEPLAVTTSGSSAAVAEAHVYLSSRSCLNDVSQAVVYIPAVVYIV